MLNQAVRLIKKVVKPFATSDGAGVSLSRTIGGPKIDNFDPFLLLDEFKSEDADDYIAGFPDHPHRGFETVTYMLTGSMEHKDHKGNKGLLRSGSVQWMTAGRGIVHSEMPKQDNGLIWGFQLWVNLPKKDKMVEPRYQDIQPENIPVVDLQDGVKVKVIAGELNGVKGAVTEVVTKPTYLDIHLPANTKFSHPVPADHNAFTYIYEGKATFLSGANDKQTVDASNLIIYEQGADVVSLETHEQPARVLLVSGKPINEPIARYGPFVMNTREEIMQAFQDFQSGRF
jgi:redox-sensitive bicupin YhaK (pirin superfamily)